MLNIPYANEIRFKASYEREFRGNGLVFRIIWGF